MIQKIITLLAISIALFMVNSCTNSISTNTQNEIQMKAVQFRIARPTNNLKEVVKFYKEGLGLKVLGHFENHAGYDGVMLGLPDKTYHLEFTQQENSTPLPPPTKENLIVFYYDDFQEYEIANQNLQKFGAQPVEPENPYWIGKSQTYEDPDGWRIVLFKGTYTPDLVPNTKFKKAFTKPQM